MLGDESRNFSDVFSEAGKIIHRQVEYQIGFHFLPRANAASRMVQLIVASRGECAPIKSDNFLERGWFNRHRELILKPNDRELRAGCIVLLNRSRSKTTYACHPGKGGRRTEWVSLAWPRIDRRFDRSHKINRRKLLCSLFCDQIVQVGFVGSGHGQALEEAFVSQSLSESLEPYFATRAQRDRARSDHRSPRFHPGLQQRRSLTDRAADVCF